MLIMLLKSDKMFTEMAQAIRMRDKLGNTVLVSKAITRKGKKGDYQLIKKSINDAEFIIYAFQKNLYFFCLVAYGTNFLVEAQWQESCYLVTGYQINPTKEYIMELLTDGTLLVL